jgi:hypothetical protein
MNFIKNKRGSGQYALAVAIAVLIIGVLILIWYLTSNPAAKQTAIDVVGAATHKS